MNKKEKIIKSLDVLSEKQIERVEEFINSLCVSNTINYSNVKDLKSKIMESQNIHRIIFKNVKGGLYQRNDKDSNISFRMKDRNLKSHIGANIDFDFMKDKKNFDDKNLDVNIIIRDGDLLKEMQESTFSVITGSNMRRTGIPLSPQQIGEVHVSNIDDLNRIFDIFEQNISKRNF